MIMNRQDVLKATGLSYTTIYNMEKAGRFPARRHLAASRVGWLRTEVQAWANGLPQVEATLTGTPAEAPYDPLTNFDVPADFKVDPLEF